MKVILLQDIPKLGHKDEVKDVSDGYARNFLLPQNLAEPATEKALRVLASKKATTEKKDAEERESYRLVSEKLGLINLSFKVKMGEKGRAFGSVSALKIQEALARQGVQIEKSWIELEEPIKTAGERKILIKLPHGFKGEVKVQVEVETK